MAAAQRAVIVGAGIGGLTTALALRQRGFQVTVLERAKHFSPIAGAGFGLNPNGQYCLWSLGLKEKLIPLLHPMKEMAFLDRNLIRHRLDMSSIGEQFGVIMGGVERSRLITLLANEVQGDLKYGEGVDNIVQEKDTVQVHTSNGKTYTADFVIGADGIYSTVAKFVEGDKSDEPVFSTENIFYGVIDDFPAAKIQNPAVAENCVTQVFQKGSELVCYHLGNGEGMPIKLIWAVTYKSDSPPKAGEWDSDDSAISQTFKNMQHRWVDQHPVHELFSKTPNNRFLHFGLFYRAHKSKWHNHRVCLLGDACHATLPYVGQGANMAIEDAIVLAQCLSAPEQLPIEDRFQKFYDLRSKRTKRMVEMAWYIGKFLHTESDVGSYIRDKVWGYSLQPGGPALNMLVSEIMDHSPVKKADIQHLL